MRPPSPSSTTMVPTLFLALLLPTLTAALTVNCDHIRIDSKKFDLHKLGGPHSVTTHDESHPPAMHNTTWTVDICAPLKKAKSLPSADQCPAGTHVCGIVTTYNPTLDPVVPEIDQVIPIAGNYEGAGSSGRALDPHYERLKGEDTERDGLRMILKGGVYAKKEQRAIIEFQCDEGRSGNEVDDERDRRGRRDGKEDDGDQEEEKSKASLTFVSYGELDSKTDVLRLNWRTKYACEDHADRDDDDDDEDGGSKKGGWGFFTWFILIAFLATATYLIFGSWLNYNRYGARGWDLLPHGDTIRDIPYLFKDFSRKVVDTVSGGGGVGGGGIGGRGGYSAV